MGCSLSSLDHENRVSLFKQTRFAIGMSQAEIDAFVSLTKVHYMNPRDIIITQGDPTRHFFIIVEGVVHMTQKDTRGIERHLGTRTFGDPVGEACLGKGSRYRRTATAQTPVTCLSITPPQLHNVISRDRLKLWESLSAESIVQIIKRINIFDDLKQQWMVELLASHFTYRRIEAGQTIVEYATPDDRSMYVISLGHITLNVFPGVGFTTSQGSHGTETGDHSSTLTPSHSGDALARRNSNDATGSDGSNIKTVVLGPGSYFGEVALMLDVPRNITATAMTDGLLLQLRESSFRHFLTLVPELQAPFQELAKNRMAEQIRGAKINLFETMPESKFPELAFRAELVHYVPGDVILKSGEIGDNFYLILNGQVSGLGADGTYLGSLSPGQCFGERSLLGTRSRTTSIVARTKCSLFAFSRAHFRELFPVARILDKGSLSVTSSQPASSIAAVTQSSKRSRSRHNLHATTPATDGQTWTKAQAQAHVAAEADTRKRELAYVASMALRLFVDEVPVMAFLAHPDSRALLMRFCERECSTENICFYTAVETYRTLARTLACAVSLAKAGTITPAIALVLIGEATFEATQAFCGPEGDEALAMKRAAAAAEASVQNVYPNLPPVPQPDGVDEQKSAPERSQKPVGHTSPSLRKRMLNAASTIQNGEISQSDIELKLLSEDPASTSSIPQSPPKISARATSAFQVVSQNAPLTHSISSTSIPTANNRDRNDSTEGAVVEFASWRLDTTATIAEQMARLNEISSTILLDAAQKIWFDYVAPREAEFEVNLQAKNVDAVQSAIESGIVVETTFDAAQSEIVFLMQDTLTRFRSSSLYADLAQHFPPIVMDEEFRTPPAHDPAPLPFTRLLGRTLVSALQRHTISSCPASQSPTNSTVRSSSMVVASASKNETDEQIFYNPLSETQVVLAGVDIAASSH